MQLPQTHRYSSVSFPQHRFIPGRTERHSESILKDIEVIPITEENWQTNECFLYGIDLFNHAYYWETHEAIEALWHLANRRETATGRLLQGIIQYSVSCLKLEFQQNNPGLRIASRALTNIDPFDGIQFGINLEQIKKDIREKMLHNKMITKPILLKRT